MSPSELPTSANVVIIGGGVIGLGIAFHLAERGVHDVVLIECNTLTSGTSWHAAGIVGPLRATYNLTRLAQYAADLFGDLESRTGQATGYTRTGGMWLAQRTERMVELERIRAMGDLCGLHARMLSPSEIDDRVPGVVVDDLVGALWVDEDGQADATGVSMAYAAGARAGGVAIHEGVTATGVVVDGGRVAGVDVTVDGEPSTISCRTVVNAAGVWSRALGAEAGVAIPVQGVEHMYIVTDPIDGLPDPHPILRDLDAGIYVKADGPQLLMGGFEYDAKPFDDAVTTPFLELGEDWDQFGPFMEAAIARYPAFETAGIRTFMNGPEGFTHDTTQVMGESPDLPGYFVCAGFNSIGLMSSAGVGQVMAEWIATGETPDYFGLDIARVDPRQADPAFLRERVRESVGDQFGMHWPFKQPTYGRGLRTTPFEWPGAHMGVTATWERPLYFGGEVPESNVTAAWWPHVEAEVQTMTNDVALLDLTPFSKIDIEGPGALAFLQYVCVANLDVEPGTIVYTQMANERGGVEADLTVTRLDGAHFRTTGGAPTRWRDLGRLRRLKADFEVTITDRTEDFAVLGVMGVNARDLLSEVTHIDGLEFGTARQADVFGTSVLMSRISYVGEPGCEITIPVGRAADVLAAVRVAGGRSRVAGLGLYGIDSCRHEKGYRHWGDDLGPDDTVLEAGLGFTIDWSKRFLGSAVLEKQRYAGVTRRLRQFVVTDGHPLILVDQPVLCSGEAVGRTTSGARGFRTDTTLLFAGVPVDADGDFTVLVNGEHHPLEVVPRPLFDPSNRRMKERW